MGVKMCVSICNAENDPLMLRNGSLIFFYTVLRIIFYK